MAKLYDNTTDYNGNFNFNGEDSRDFGLIITEAPAFTRPTRKQTAFEVPGRNGVILFQQDAWNDTPRAYKVALAVDHEIDMAAKVADVESWLNSADGYMRLEDNFEPDFFRLAYYSGGDEFSNNFMQYGEATINFTCRPERFYKSGDLPATLTNGTPINNPTRFIAKPLIHIEGSGAVSVTLGAATMTATITDYINIDTARMDAYRLPAENMNNKISGTFPTLAPGANAVTLSGSITDAYVLPRFYEI